MQVTARSWKGGSTGDRSKRGGMEQRRPAEGMVEILQTSIELEEKRIGE
jgi:hypothetical protein